VKDVLLQKLLNNSINIKLLRIVMNIPLNSKEVYRRTDWHGRCASALFCGKHDFCVDFL